MGTVNAKVDRLREAAALSAQPAGSLRPFPKRSALRYPHQTVLWENGVGEWKQRSRQHFIHFMLPLLGTDALGIGPEPRRQLPLCFVQRPRSSLNFVKKSLFPTMTRQVRL